MMPFSTEFPVNGFKSRSDFIAQVFSWIRGIESSCILDRQESTDLDHENVYLRSDSGEELRFREFGTGSVFEAIGFRHDLPDNQDRIWRTEAVLRRGADSRNLHVIRLRTQCIASGPGARIETPRKPYLIKMILNDGVGGVMGFLM